jgi:hypothetical protein
MAQTYDRDDVQLGGGCQGCMYGCIIQVHVQSSHRIVISEPPLRRIVQIQREKEGAVQNVRVRYPTDLALWGVGGLADVGYWSRSKTLLTIPSRPSATSPLPPSQNKTRSRYYVICMTIHFDRHNRMQLYCGTPLRTQDTKHSRIVVTNITSNKTRQKPLPNGKLNS